MFRKSLAVLALLVLTACGSDATSPSDSYIAFKVDASTCSGSATLAFFIDGTQVGSELMTPGGSSAAYPTSAGSHVISATVANTNGRVWSPRTVSVPTHQTYLAVLTCT